MSSDIYSFYDLIEKYTITIPVIQRAYAEGRNTKQAEDVRKSITAAIINAVTEGKALFFDFVYGNIEEKKFIPFDGQQRLTTLFLFHRYVFEVAGESMYLLKKFTYKTRPSSSEFIEKLCENNIIPKDGIALSEYLTNQNWFFDDWKKDPTISSMLVVLDEIHWQISSRKNIDFKKILDGLKTSKLITFHFVNMKENKLPAATYIKMNARGKSLTAFENFKASLEEYLNEKDAKLSARLKENIDSKWLDLFYNRTKEREQKLPDASLMAFFNRHFINIWNLQDDLKSVDKDMKSKIESDLVSFPEIDTFISWDVYKTILDNCKVDEFFIPLFNFLDALKDNEGIETVKDYDKNWTWLDRSKNNANETYPSRVKFFAWLVYFRCEQYEEISFKNWMRVAFNIIENQTIDSQDSYKGALKLIKELSEHSHRIYEYLADNSNKIESNFASEQVKEERLKAKKLLESSEWKERIREAEKYEILLGKINVLFQDGENTSIGKFKERFTLLKSLYENEKDKYHIVKVLLSYWDVETPPEKISLVNTAENIKYLVTNKLFSPFQQIQEDKINSSIRQEWKKELVETNLLNISRGKQLKKYGNKVVLWGTEGCIWSTFGNAVWGNVILGDSKRSTLLKSLNLPNEDIKTDYKAELFFSGWETNFKFENCYFQWWTRDNSEQCDVYLMEDNWAGYKERKLHLSNEPQNSDVNKFFAFNATDEMVKDKRLFVDALRKLTTEAKK